MKLILNMSFTFSIVEKRGLHYAQIWDVETMNLVFEEESLTRQGAEASILNFIQTCMRSVES